jgi:hypothetical protein
MEKARKFFEAIADAGPTVLSQNNSGSGQLCSHIHVLFACDIEFVERRQTQRATSSVNCLVIFALIHK